MYSDFELSTQLDFIALESAVMNFETINNFNDFFKADTDQSEPDDATAMESATPDSDFAFGAGLFEETVANESTYPTEPALEGIGGKIWGAIKAMFAAIANFFKNLFKRSSAAETNLNKKSTTSITTSNKETIRKGEPIILPPSDSAIKERDEAIRKEAEYKKQQAQIAKTNKEYNEYKEKEKKEQEEREAIRRKMEAESQERLAKVKAEREAAEREHMKAEAERRKKAALDSCDRAIRDYVQDTFVAFNKYYDAVKDACDLMGDTTIPTIVKKISKSLEGLRNHKDVNVSTSAGVNDAAHLYKSQVNSDNRGAIYSEDVNRDLLTIGNIADQCARHVELAEKARKIYNEKAQRIIKIAETHAGQYIKEIEIRDKAHQLLHESLYTRKRKQETVNTIKNIQNVCRDNIKFCTTVTGHNYEDLDWKGSGLYFICKRYLEVSKYYSKITVMMIET